MKPRTLQFIAQAADGTLSRGEPGALARRVYTDSRQVQPGDLFVALKGERFDAHDYLDEVVRKGARAVVVERGRAEALEGDCAVIEVDDTRRALGRIAAAHRADFDIPAIAVAGSNGKTSTKELIAAQLRQLGEALWSRASFNNEVGVPLTLLELDERHCALVQEVGTNHPGELRPLLEIVRPQIGVITSIGREHLEHFGDLEGVIAEEGVLAGMLPADGLLVINGDDPNARRIAGDSAARVVRVGFESGNDWSISEAVMTLGGMRFSVRGPARTLEDLHIPLLGRHQVINAVLALAVGTELGLSGEQSRRALGDCTPPKGRLQLSEENGIRLIDDSYNANADSMAAALATLAELPVAGRRIVVLGDMAELGAHSEAAHREVGRRVAELGMDMLFTVGAMGYCYAGEAKERGVKVVCQFDEAAEAAVSLRRVLRPGDAVLVKASRSAGLERVLEELRGKLGTPDPDNHEQGEHGKAIAA